MDKDVPVDMADLGLVIAPRVSIILSAYLLPVTYQRANFRYYISNSRRLHEPDSSLVQSFKEQEIKKRKDLLNEPCEDYVTTEELAKDASNVILPGDKCKTCKKRRARMLHILRKVLLFDCARRVSLYRFKHKPVCASQNTN